MRKERHLLDGLGDYRIRRIEKQKWKARDTQSYKQREKGRERGRESEDDAMSLVWRENKISIVASFHAESHSGCV